MTLEEIEASLLNGFHDAQISGFAMSYEKLRLTLQVEILVGVPEQPHPQREAYRPGIIEFREARLFSIKLPDAKSAFRSPGRLWFSYERTAPEVIPGELVAALSPATHYYSLFVLDWHSSIHIAAEQVEFSWAQPVDAPYNRP
jgi:hypothetical protein